jgi:NADH dehydrogenase FAD-containing subunit
VAAEGLQNVQHLVLVGASLAHVQVLQNFAMRRVMSVNITLIAPSLHPVHLGLVPDFVAGSITAESCTMVLDGLLKQAGATWVKATVTGLDAQAKRLTLSNHGRIQFDILSLSHADTSNRTPVQAEASMPGAGQHALNFWPLEIFCTLWPQLTTLAQTRALNIAVVGGSVQAVALALAVEHGLKNHPGTPPSHQPCRVSLVTGGQAPAAEYPQAVQRQLNRALKRQHITVLRDHCTGINTTELQLASGARLACDAPLLALPPLAPPWQAESGLQLNDAGGIAVNSSQQSISHPTIFVTAGGEPTGRTGRVLVHNLRATLNATALKPLTIPAFSLELLFCGARQAVGVLHTPWGSLSGAGTWLAYWKGRREKNALQRVTTLK